MAKRTSGKEVVAVGNEITVNSIENAALANDILMQEAIEAELLDMEFEALETQSELAIQFRNLVIVYNEQVTAGNMALATQTDAMLKDVLKKLNANEKAVQVQTWLASPDPIVTALHDGGTYKLTNVKRNKETLMIDDIVIKPAIIDLRDLYMAKKEIVADNRWLAYCEAANVAIRDFMVKIMGVKHMTDKLKGFQLTATSKILGIKEADMKTAKGCQGALQKVVNSIFGMIDNKPRFIVTQEDAEAFRYTYASWGTQGVVSVKFSIEATFRKILTRILVRIVNELDYAGE